MLSEPANRESCYCVHILHICIVFFSSIGEIKPNCLCVLAEFFTMSVTDILKHEIVVLATKLQLSMFSVPSTIIILISANINLWHISCSLRVFLKLLSRWLLIAIYSSRSGSVNRTRILSEVHFFRILFSLNEDVIII